MKTIASFLVEKSGKNSEYEGKKIRIINMDDELSGKNYNGKTGTVKYVDDIGQLHGTWGSLAVIPEIDEFEVID